MYLELVFELHGFRKTRDVVSKRILGNAALASLWLRTALEDIHRSMLGVARLAVAEHNLFIWAVAGHHKHHGTSRELQARGIIISERPLGRKLTAASEYYHPHDMLSTATTNLVPTRSDMS